MLGLKLAYEVKADQAISEWETDAVDCSLINT